MSSELNRFLLNSLQLEQEEKKLADKLRYQLCDKDGKETDKSASGKILYELALIYKKRDFDKVCLIQSTALLIAAQIRCPETHAIVQKDLETLWSNVLGKANAKTTEFSFELISHYIQGRVNKMRSDTRKKIELIPKYTDFLESDSIPNEESFLRNELQAKEVVQEKIVFVEALQNEVANEYISVMNYLTKYICETLLQAPPCRFAFVGLGSLSRKEVTPSSDFECIIVLEENIENSLYESTIEYFRWFAVIFQMVLIGLGETILPNVAISSLNDFYDGGDNWFYDDFTPSGIHFDGFMPFACKTPLGRQQWTKRKTWKTELIKPIKEMLAYLSSEENLKNGYHLADVLCQICFVAGDEKLYSDFEDQVHLELEKQRQNDPSFNARLKDMVEKDLIKFGTSSHTFFPSTPEANNEVKHYFYRSMTIFISSLGKFHGLRSYSSFDIIRELEKRKVLSEEDAVHLKYAVAIGCEIRFKDCEKPLDILNKMFMTSLTERIGEKTVIDFIAISMSLQLYLKYEHENPLQQITLDADLDFKRIVICYYGFRWYRRTIRYCRIHLQKIHAQNLEVMAEICYFLGCCAFCIYNPKEAREKFVQWVLDIVLSKGIVGNEKLKYCLSLYSCIISNHLDLKRDDFKNLPSNDNKQESSSSLGRVLGQLNVAIETGGFENTKPSELVNDMFESAIDLIENPLSAGAEQLMSLAETYENSDIFTSDSFGALTNSMLETLGDDWISAEDRESLKTVRFPKWSKNSLFVATAAMIKFRAALFKVKLELEEDLNSCSDAFDLD